MFDASVPDGLADVDLLAGFRRLESEFLAVVEQKGVNGHLLVRGGVAPCDLIMGYTPVVCQQAKENLRRSRGSPALKYPSARPLEHACSRLQFLMTDIEMDPVRRDSESAVLGESSCDGGLVSPSRYSVRSNQITANGKGLPLKSI